MRTKAALVAFAVIAAAGSHTTVHGQPPAEKYTGPRIVVRRGVAPVQRAAEPSAAGHAIPVPANTVFEGPPLWYTRGLQSADLRIANATADWIEAQADRLERRRFSVGVPSSVLYLEPLILPWPMGTWYTPQAGPLVLDMDDGADGGAAEARPAPVDDDAQPSPARQRPGAASDQEYTGPVVVVRRNGAARAADGPPVRRIHLPGGTVTIGGAPARGAIPVPANTLYDGPPLWYVRGLQSADLRIANATADWVEAQAGRVERWGTRRR